MPQQEADLQSPMIDVSLLTLDELDRYNDGSPLHEELRALLDTGYPQDAAAGFEAAHPFLQPPPSRRRTGSQA